MTKLLLLFQLSFNNTNCFLTITFFGNAKDLLIRSKLPIFVEFFVIILLVNTIPSASFEFILDKLNLLINLETFLSKLNGILFILAINEGTHE